MADQKMWHLESDIQKIQVKTNMYIKEYGPEGTFHLFREIAQNNFDECLESDSPGRNIDISYDLATEIIRCEDDGRSFNEADYPLKIFCTTLQSGSKFFRSGDSTSSGEFGVGMTVVNALSSYFKIIAFREKEMTKHELEFRDGEIVKDKVTTNKNGRHGTIIEFKTSKKYMGDDVSLPIEDVVKWLDSLFYLNEKNLRANGIKCTFTVYDGMEVVETFKFKPQPFYQLLNKIIPSNIKKKKMTEICQFSNQIKFEENTKTLIENKDGTMSVGMAIMEKTLHMDIAFQYCTSADYNDPAFYDTYCNYTNTIENGVHLVAFEESYCRYMQGKINATMSDAQKQKLKITWDDIRTNLFCIINLSTNAQVGFVGNAKEKIDNKELIPYMKEIISSGLDEFFKSNSGLLDTYIKIIKLNAKARLEAQKAKVVTQRERMDSFKELLNKKFIPCNNKGKQWKEIFMVEGDSASSSARNGCDPDTQAFFLFRGVVANAEKCTLAEIMNNTEWKEFVNVLRCGIGPTFDINKLYFDRINIFTDADIDGYFISAGMLTFFYNHMRPIIEAGKLYKVFSPLYRIDDKDNPFVANKAEMVSIYHKKITKNYKIKLEGCSKYMSKNEMYEFLMDTYDYRDNLIRAAKESGKVNKFLVEMIVAYLTMMNVVRSEDDFNDIEKTFGNQKFIKTIMSNVQKKYKEITVDNTGRFSGIIEGKYVIIQAGSRLFKKTSDLIPIYQKYGYKLTVEENGKEREMSIGEFLDNCMKLTPRILTRYKGLGELNGDQLHDTTLDINNRISVQYTIDDVERELKIFAMTHGSSKQNMADRKRMMKEYKIKREDLDN